MADTCQIRKNNGLSAIFMVKCASLMFFVLVALVFWVLVAYVFSSGNLCFGFW